MATQQQFCQILLFKYISRLLLKSGKIIYFWGQTLLCIDRKRLLLNSVLCKINKTNKYIKILLTLEKATNSLSKYKWHYDNWWHTDCNIYSLPAELDPVELCEEWDITCCRLRLWDLELEVVLQWSEWLRVGLLVELSGESGGLLWGYKSSDAKTSRVLSKSIFLRSFLISLSTLSSWSWLDESVSMIVEDCRWLARWA